MTDLPTPRRMSDRMAGGAFALAADPSLLAAHARHRGRLQHRGDPARGLCRIRPASVGPRFRRRQCHRPHKERALALSTPDDRARAVGAANTLWYDGDELRSTNTDVEGFISNLDASAPGWDEASDALVFGAGGSSRAVLFGLIERGIKRVHLANRTVARAQALADQFGAAFIRCHGMRSATLLPGAHLLVNTTSLGMHGQPPLEDRSRPAAAGCRGRRPRLRAARDAVAGGGAGARATDGGRARHAAAPGGARLCPLVRVTPAGHAGAARAARGRSHGRFEREYHRSAGVRCYAKPLRWRRIALLLFPRPCRAHCSRSR